MLFAGEMSAIVVFLFFLARRDGRLRRVARQADLDGAPHLLRWPATLRSSLFFSPRARAASPNGTAWAPTPVSHTPPIHATRQKRRTDSLKSCHWSVRNTPRRGSGTVHRVDRTGTGQPRNRILLATWFLFLSKSLTGHGHSCPSVRVHFFFLFFLSVSALGRTIAF